MQYASALTLFAALLLGAGCKPASAPTGNAPPSEAGVAHGVDVTPPTDAQKSASGLLSKQTKSGRGDARPTKFDKVLVNFTAYSPDGAVKDSSAQRGGPATFAVTGVVAGWTEALLEMRVGEQRRLWIPDHLMYPGRPGFPRPLAMFDLELLEIIADKLAPATPSDVAAAPADATQLPSGVAYKLLTQRDGGEKPRAWDRVSIHYAGWTADGTLFESSQRERPASFDLPGVLPGWREVLPRLVVGERARLWLPEALAYAGRVGAPKGPVVFEIELVSIEQRPEPPRAPKELARAPASAVRTKSGLAYRLLRKGEGKTKPGASDKVEVHYSAWNSAGELVDSSVARGAPTTLPMGHVIPGWAEGLSHMVEGDVARLWIPEPLAYAGREGSPKGMLVYDVELLRILP